MAIIYRCRQKENKYGEAGETHAFQEGRALVEDGGLESTERFELNPNQFFTFKRN
jgi:hypothetical protein